MKKLPIVLCTCLFLAGCGSFEPDIDRAATRRAASRAAHREEFGCPFSDEHAAYRDCIMKTRAQTTPRRVKLGQTEDGRSVVVTRDETTHTYDRETDMYKTERVVVIETEERLVPVPVAEPVTTTEEVTVVEQTATEEPTGKPFDVITIEETPPIVADEPVVVEPQPVEPAPKETWWDTYQKGKTDVLVDDSECPCPDPNDPCPQCVDK